MRKLFLKISGIAVLIITLNLNPLINIFLTETIEVTGQNENQVVNNITGGTTPVFPVKNSLKNPNTGFYSNNISIYKICELSQNIIFQIELNRRFPSLLIKFPRWSKCTFT